MSGSMFRRNQAAVKETYFAVQIGDFKTAWPYLMRDHSLIVPQLYDTLIRAQKAANKLNAAKGNDAAKAIQVWIRSK